jgi:MFS family permease
VLAALTFVLGAGEAIFTPLYESVLPDLTDQSALQRANALSNLVKNLATVIGPGIEGVLVAAIGVRNLLVIDVATFAVSVLAVAGLQRRYGHAEQGGDDAHLSAWRAAAEGVSVVLKQRWLAALEGMAVVHTLFAVGPWYVLVPVLAVERYGSVADYGLLLAAFGAGGVIGAMAGAHVNSGHRGLIALAGIGTFGFACLIEGWRVPVYVVGAVFVVAGFGTQMFDVVKTTAIQTVVKRQYLGRVFSLDFFASFVTMPFGQVIAGLVVGHVSADIVMRVCGMIVIATTLLPALVPGAAAFRNPVGIPPGHPEAGIRPADRTPPQPDAAL